jgi:hypothetical protein
MDENKTNELVARLRDDGDNLRQVEREARIILYALTTEAADTIERLREERDEAVLVMADGIYEATLAGQTGIREHGLALTVERLRAAAARIAQLENELEDERFSSRVERYLKGGERYD